MKRFPAIERDGQKPFVFCPILFFSVLLLLCAAPVLGRDAHHVSSWLILENDASLPVFMAPMGEDGQFAIRYRHSVAQTPVIDYFRLKGHEIWLDKTVYQDFGAGLPHAPEEGQTMTHKDGELIISGYNRRMPSFQLRVGNVAGHTLLLFGSTPATRDVITREIPLDRIAQPGSTLTFTAGPDLSDRKKQPVHGIQD